MVWLNWWGVNKIVGGGFDSRTPHFGLLAQLVRVAGLHPAGRRFESCTVHWEHGMFPRCCYALLVVVHVTAWARVVGLRASRWACYYALIAARCPPGLPSCIVSVAELADALDLGSSAFGRVGSTPTGRTSGKCFLHFLLPLAFRSCYDGWDAVRRIGSIGRATAL